jgi:Cytidine and deoxycytidylate deaminase zinc-binding region
MALRNAARKLQRHLLPGSVLYSSSEPCPMCLTACYWARVSRVVFGATSDDPSWVTLVHTWPSEEQSRASRKASSRALKSLTRTGVRNAVTLMANTRWGIGPSATGNLVRKSARCERQTPSSAPRGIVQGRNVSQVGAPASRQRAL